MRPGSYAYFNSDHIGANPLRVPMTAQGFPFTFREWVALSNIFKSSTYYYALALNVVICLALLAVAGAAIELGYAAHEKEADPMTDTPPPRRRFRQIHLSTAVVLMLTASMLLYLNVRRAHRVLPPGETADFGWHSMMHPNPPPMDYIAVTNRPGWPLTSTVVVAYSKEYGLNVNAKDDGLKMVNQAVQPATPDEAVAMALRALGQENAEGRRWWNIGIAASILLLVMFLSEFLIRRRSKS
jgi:hypothetical protein